MTEDKRSKILFNTVRIALYDQARILTNEYFRTAHLTVDLHDLDTDGQSPELYVSVIEGVVEVLCRVTFTKDLQKISKVASHLHVCGEKTLGQREVGLVHNAMTAFGKAVGSITER